MDTNSVFRLVYPAYDMTTYVFKVNVFTKQAEYEKNSVFRSSRVNPEPEAKYEYNLVLFSSLHVFHVLAYLSVYLGLTRGKQTGTG